MNLNFPLMTLHGQEHCNEAATSLCVERLLPPGKEPDFLLFNYFCSLFERPKGFKTFAEEISERSCAMREIEKLTQLTFRSKQDFSCVIR